MPVSEQLLDVVFHHLRVWNSTDITFEENLGCSQQTYYDPTRQYARPHGQHKEVS